MAVPLVKQHRSWRHLLRALTAPATARWMQRFTHDELQKGMVIPVAVARWIVQFRPELLSRDSLHLVIAGAEQGADSAAGGRWYQMLPTLLGQPHLTIKVSLVGPHVNGTTSGGSPLTNLQSDMPWQGMPLTWPAAGRFPVTLGEFSRQQGLSSVDLVAVPHPGLEFDPARWLTEDELATVTTAGIPVALFTYAADEFEMERWAAATFGYQVSPQVEENPFSLKPDTDVGMPIAIAHTLWHITHGPAAGSTPDDQMLGVLHQYMTTADAWISAGEGSLLPEIGRLLDEGDNLVFIPPVLGASLDTGKLFLLENGNLSPAPFELPQNVIDARPSLADLPFARMAWALQVCQVLVEACQE